MASEYSHKERVLAAVNMSDGPSPIQIYVTPEIHFA